MINLVHLRTTALTAGIFLFSSCGSGLLGTPADKDMTKPEGMKAIKEKIVKAFGADKKIYSCQIMAKEDMSNEFGMATISFIENGKDMTQTFLTAPEEKTKPAEESSMQNELFLKKKQGSVALKDLDFDKILSHVKEAETMIPKEYESINLNHWTYNVSNDNKVTADFKMEGSKKGEGTKQQGRMIVSNYYEFGFTMDDKGKITANE